MNTQEEYESEGDLRSSLLDNSSSLEIPTTSNTSKTTENTETIETTEAAEAAALEASNTSSASKTVEYNKFLESKYNVMKIEPVHVQRQKTYYLGVFRHKTATESHFSDEYDFVETVRAPSRIEDYFPMTVEAFNTRSKSEDVNKEAEKWRCLSTEEALKADYIDFSWTNLPVIAQKSVIHYRFLIDGKENFLTDKNAFCTEFRDETRFCPRSIQVSLKNIRSNAFRRAMRRIGDFDLILKPDKGSVSTGIKIIETTTKYSKIPTAKLIKEITEHIQKFTFEGWTLSELIRPRLFDGYITSLRLYLLITKTTKHVGIGMGHDTDATAAATATVAARANIRSRIRGYLFDHYMIYRAENRYAGDPTDKLTFFTN